MALGIAGMLQVLQVIIAIPLLFFIPGYFLVSVIFSTSRISRKKHHLELYEKMALSILSSLGINMIFGLALASAGRFTAANLWIGMMVISAFLVAALVATYLIVPKPHS